MYVLRELASKFGITLETVDKGVAITNLFGDSVLANRVYRRCPLEVQGQVFYVNLMELPFYGFNVILRKDWVIEHKAKIEIELKKDTL